MLLVTKHPTPLCNARFTDCSSASSSEARTHRAGLRARAARTPRLRLGCSQARWQRPWPHDLHLEQRPAPRAHGLTRGRAAAGRGRQKALGSPCSRPAGSSLRPWEPCCPSCLPDPITAVKWCKDQMLQIASAQHDRQSSAQYMIMKLPSTAGHCSSLDSAQHAVRHPAELSLRRLVLLEIRETCLEPADPKRACSSWTQCPW